MTDDSPETPPVFQLDFNATERLIACLIDGHFGSDRARGNLVRDAYEIITGKRVDRVDEPDSAISQKMFAFMRADYTNRLNQHTPEYGGPVISSKEDQQKYKEKTAHALAQEVAGGDDNLKQYIYKRFRGEYGHSLIEADSYAYVSALMDWGWGYDEAKERALYQDLKTVGSILEKHGVKMDLRRVFWRVA